MNNAVPEKSQGSLHSKVTNSKILIKQIYIHNNTAVQVCVSTSQITRASLSCAVHYVLVIMLSQGFFHCRFTNSRDIHACFIKLVQRLPTTWATAENHKFFFRLEVCPLGFNLLYSTHTGLLITSPFKIFLSNLLLFYFYVFFLLILCRIGFFLVESEACSDSASWVADGYKWHQYLGYCVWNLLIITGIS